MNKKRYKIAIIGTGVAGCAAAYYLNKDHDITVFEANGYIGGHVNTIDVNDDGNKLSIDTGFIVFNDKTYPNFLSLMDEIGQQSQDSVMSFSVVNKLKNLEYSGSTVNGLFSQRRNIFSLSFLNMIKDILRFNRTKSNQFESLGSLSLKDFLRKNNYSMQFVEDYLLPMASSIWSAEQKEILSMPIKFLHNFFHNHCLLQIKNRPQWKVIQGGSREYIRKLSATYLEKINLNTKVQSIERNEESVTIGAADRDISEDFDYVINLQGDMPLINPLDIKKVLIPLKQGFDISTLVTNISEEEEENINITKAEINWIKKNNLGEAINFYKISKKIFKNIYHHVGIYGFRYNILKKFVSLKPSVNELYYKLEQLRAIDAKMSIGTSYVKNVPLSVDTRDDLMKVQNIIRKINV